MNIKSLLIGGLLPTVLLGLGTVLMKLSLREGSSVPNYLVQVGGTVLGVGLAVSALTGTRREYRMGRDLPALDGSRETLCASSG